MVIALVIRSLTPCSLSLSFSCCLFLSSLPQIWAKYHSNNLYTLGFPDGTSGKESTCQCRRCSRCGFSPLVQKISWVGNCTPLQYSSLETSMGRGAWRATVHGATESDMTEHSPAHFILHRALLFNKSSTIG